MSTMSATNAMPVPSTQGLPRIPPTPAMSSGSAQQRAMKSTAPGPSGRPLLARASRLVVMGVLVSFGFGSAAAVAAAGLMLAQIRQIVDIRDAGHAPCDHGRELLDARLRDIEQQIAQLSALRDTIAGLRDDAAQPEPETCSAGQVCRYV